MKDNIKQIVKLGFFISLSATLLFIAFRNINFSLVLEELKNARYSWLIIALAASMLAFISRARRWILLIKPLGYEPSLRSAYHALMTGYLFNFAAPRLGELTRCAALGRKEKIPVDRLFGTVIAERAFDMVSMLIIMLIMIAGRSSLMNSFFKDDVFGPLGGKIASSLTLPVPAVIIVLLFILAAVIMLTVYRRRLRQVKLLARIGDILKGIYSGLKSFTAMKDRLEFIIHTIIIWSLYIIMTWAVFYALPATSHLQLADAVFILVAGSLGMAAPVQGGIGAFHWIVSRALNIVYGISLEGGLAYATLSHESQLILIAVLGTVSFFLIMGRKQKKYRQPEQTE